MAKLTKGIDELRKILWEEYGFEMLFSDPHVVNSYGEHFWFSVEFLERAIKEGYEFHKDIDGNYTYKDNKEINEYSYDMFLPPEFFEEEKSLRDVLVSGLDKMTDSVRIVSPPPPDSLDILLSEIIYDNFWLDDTRIKDLSKDQQMILNRKMIDVCLQLRGKLS